MVEDDTHFPSTLLRRAPADRLAYFKAYTVAHTRMEDVFAALVQAIREPANAAYILVLGPTGVGKTTLRLGVERHLVATLETELERDPGRLPVCSTTAVSPDSGNFNWKDYYRRALQALAEPLVSDKIRTGATRPLAMAEATALRRALESALQHRRPQAFIVDEAQHFLKITSGRRLQDQMDSIKSLADHGQTVHVLIGTYDLLALQTLNGQGIRRGITLHFPRYRADVPADVLAFQRVLVSFEQQLPVREPPTLLTRWPYCFERSLGCVGILKDWLTRALATALVEDADTVSEAHLAPGTRLRVSFSASACEHILSEAIQGEERLVEGEDGAAQLRLRLGLTTRETAVPAAPCGRRPGERAPTRDPLQPENRHVG